MSTLKPFVKTKWCDIAYFLAQVRALRTVVGIESSEDEAETFVPACTWQDHCMARVEKGELHPLEFASRMVVMAFVRATCSRGGSVCKDWFDRAGLMLHWLTRNVTYCICILYCLTLLVGRCCRSRFNR